MPTNETYTLPPRICKPGGKGIILPLWESENDVDYAIRCPIYTVLLVYCFIGVSIVAETFCGAIEAIASRRQQIKLKSTGRVITVRIWNDTVSNLTLMALGSSAPEILLSTIELFKKDMMSGELGPSTIVGSAAFNLMVIIGVCISIIPNGETRKVKELSVFFVTLVFSLLAYLWLLVILVAITPDQVDIEEAVITFLFFPVLVLISYLADIGKLSKSLRPRASRLKWNTEDEIPDEIVVRVCDLVGMHDIATTAAARKGILDHPDLVHNLESPSIPDIENLKKAIMEHKPKSRAARRIEATRHFTGGRKPTSGGVFGHLHMPHLMPHMGWRSSASSSQDISGGGELATLASTNACDFATLGSKRPGDGPTVQPPTSSHSMAMFRGSATTGYIAPAARIMAHVTFAVGSQCISEELPEKSVLLVRKGDQSLDLKVNYSVNLRLGDVDNGTASQSEAFAATANSSMDAHQGPTVGPGGMYFPPNQTRTGSASGTASQQIAPRGSEEIVTVPSQSGADSQFPSASSRNLSNQPWTSGSNSLELVPVETGQVIMPRGDSRKMIKVARPDPAAMDRAVDIWAKATGKDASSLIVSEKAFIVKLDSVQVVTNLDKSEKERNMTLSVVNIGPVVLTQVNIVPPSPGKLAFAYEHLSVQGLPSKQLVDVIVCRRAGCTGSVGCKFHTEQLSSVPSYDYTEADGNIEFEEGETEQLVSIEILSKGINESTDEFLVVLEDAQGGASFDANDDGGTESSILTVKINALQGLSSSTSGRLLRALDRCVNFDEMSAGFSQWHDQFVAAIYCNGSPEEQAEAGKMDWFFHIVSFPWKLLFSLVPPTCFGGGWPCFYFSLLMIALVTAVIGDFAELFGCVIDLEDGVTAIIFVALGTSMPDLFASRSAAIGDAYADASICNVTGSNSVNVFLGLGLPWSIGAIYWKFKDPTPKWISRYPEDAIRLKGEARFIVKSDDLGFSVLVFSCASLFTLGILTFRRAMLGAELGGPFKAKITATTAFIMFWIIYIILASWKMVRKSKPDALESALIICSLGGLSVVTFVVAIIVTYSTPVEPGNRDVSQDAAAGKSKCDGAGKRIDARCSEGSDGSSREQKVVLDTKENLTDPDLPVVASEKIRAPEASVGNGETGNAEPGIAKDGQAQASGAAAAGTSDVACDSSKDQAKESPAPGFPGEGSSTIVTVESPRSSPMGSHHEVDDVSVRRIFCCLKMCGEPTSREERIANK